MRLEEAHRALEPYRRPDGPDGQPGSLRFNVEDPDAAQELRTFLSGHGLAGLSIGQCGWSDLTARIRGKGLEEGVRLMILGADWYPITRCSRFLLNRYGTQTNTLNKFFKKLGLDAAGEDPEVFIKDKQVYLGNTLLCYRTGWDKTGPKNLSDTSFDNCATLLKDHIDALLQTVDDGKPLILVTLGQQPWRRVAGLLEGDTKADREALENLGPKNRSLKKVMEGHYDGKGSPCGIAASRAGRKIAFVPLYHPSRSDANKYAHDYDALNNLLK